MDNIAELKRDLKSVTLAGDLTVENASEIRDALIEAIHKEDGISLDISGVTDLDVSFLQIICSLHRTVFKTGKTINIQGEMPRSIRHAISDYGYICRGDCIYDEQKTCVFR